MAKYYPGVKPNAKTGELLPVSDITKRDNDNYLNRNVITQFVRKHIKTTDKVRLTSLPCEEPVWESNLINSGAIGKRTLEILAIERSPATFAIMDSTLQNIAWLTDNQIEYESLEKATTVDDFAISYTGEPSDIVYLDLCGSWSIALREAFTAMLTRGLVKDNCLFGFTLTLTNKQGVDKQLEEAKIKTPNTSRFKTPLRLSANLGEKILKTKSRSFGVERQIVETAAAAGYKAVTKDLALYRKVTSTNKGTIMTTLWFELEKIK